MSSAKIKLDEMCCTIRRVLVTSVCISNYEGNVNWSRLQSCRSDHRHIQQWTEKYEYNHIANRPEDTDGVLKCSKHDLSELLDKTTTEIIQNHSCYDLYLFIYSGHGMNKYGQTSIVLSSSKGDELESTQSIINRFVPSGPIGEKFLMKPKIFIFDCCRSEEKPAISTSTQNIKGQAAIRTENGWVHPQSNILTLFGNMPGYECDGDKQGSYLINAFLNNWGNTDVDTLIKRIRAEVRRKTNGEQLVDQNGSLIYDKVNIQTMAIGGSNNNDIKPAFDYLNNDNDNDNDNDSNNNNDNDNDSNNNNNNNASIMVWNGSPEQVVEHDIAAETMPNLEFGGNNNESEQPQIEQSATDIAEAADIIISNNIPHHVHLHQEWNDNEVVFEGGIPENAIYGTRETNENNDNLQICNGLNLPNLSDLSFTPNCSPAPQQAERFGIMNEKRKKRTGKEENDDDDSSEEKVQEQTQSASGHVHSNPINSLNRLNSSFITDTSPAPTIQTDIASQWTERFGCGGSVISDHDTLHGFHHNLYSSNNENRINSNGINNTNIDGNMNINNDQHLSAPNHPFMCNICNRTYCGKQTLQIHKRTHDPNRKIYDCRFCGRKFKSEHKYKQHIRMHINGAPDKPYACNICPKRFRERSLLKGHMNIHTGARPFVCSICHRSYANMNSYRSHQRKYHH